MQKAKKYSQLEDGDKFRSSIKDLKYNLKRSDYRYIPLTEAQKTKINSAMGTEVDPEKYLSPKQLMWLNELDTFNPKKEILYNIEIRKAWKKIDV